MGTVVSLTVDRVSGLIALGNWIVTFTAPFLLGILLVNHLDGTLSAASWSVLARQLHSSDWPSLLRSKSVASKKVDRRVSVVAYLNLAMTIFGIISGVVSVGGHYG
ncbi:hypothetical protein JDV02_006556 [Purpureocillium takamizusanense]|uniref:Uncharacterized protein n=1 Tax=Purpureocillium takamizusanense TaxID=2060973 RepID=A0A9Q8QIX3_9HYPO|nr:uncharacterized protein JDV02_006556 [Purpureocillium takamizusanense]UNI20475.1 hypothetical protein JDV02_006556 [Purpureocillium takamizusanense]